MVPSVRQILRVQCWVSLQQFRFACSETPGLFQEPDGNTCADNARFAAADIREAFHTGKRIAEIMGDPLQELRFLPAYQVWEQSFRFLNCAHNMFLFRRRLPISCLTSV